MEILPIRTKADYSRTLKEIETLMDTAPKSQKGERLDVGKESDRTVWATNYDQLLEQGYLEAKKTPDIQAFLDDDAKITEILRGISRRRQRKDIYVSGSAHDFDPMGRYRIEGLSQDIGREIIRNGYNLISGFGLGIGGAVIVGAMEELYADSEGDFREWTTLRPFPQEPPRGMSREVFWSWYREDMIANAGFVVFLCGNKIDPKTGETVLADGVMEEFEKTKRLGKYPIPVGATGHAARRIWDEVNASPEKFFPGGGVKRHIRTLGSADSTDRAIIEAVFAIVKRVVSK